MSQFELHIIPHEVYEGCTVTIEVRVDDVPLNDSAYDNLVFKWNVNSISPKLVADGHRISFDLGTYKIEPGSYDIEVHIKEKNVKGGTAFAALAPSIGTLKSPKTVKDSLHVLPKPFSKSDLVDVLDRTGIAKHFKPDAPIMVDIQTKRYQKDSDSLYVAIKNRTDAISYKKYEKFISDVLCDDPGKADTSKADLHDKSKKLKSYGVHAYDLLKTATEIFLLLECGVAIKDDFKPDEEQTRLGSKVNINEIKRRLENYLSNDRLPYLQKIIDNLGLANDVESSPFCKEPVVLTSRVETPCLLELIWSYWHEQGMLVQTMNLISLRFQNKRISGVNDPLATLEMDSLRPISNFIWGYIQDEFSRLTVSRRSFEYEHEYGLKLLGKAIPNIAAADRRSNFLEAFHNLLHKCAIFYTEENDKTIIPDAFPLLNMLKEMHLILAHGAHNQFADLPWTARVEMLTQQWILARPEMREFLGRRPMVAYPEGWMDRVDTVKNIMGWPDVNIKHFRDLGVFGEKIILSIRYKDWNDIDDQEEARNWALYFKQEIQGYIHGYRAVTGGIDLTNPNTIDFVQPSVHLQKRLTAQGAWM